MLSPHLDTSLLGAGVAAGEEEEQDDEEQQQTEANEAEQSPNAHEVRAYALYVVLDAFQPYIVLAARRIRTDHKCNSLACSCEQN